MTIYNDPNRSKKGRYILNDNFFRFYAYFIYPNLSRFLSDGDKGTIENLVHREWQSYSGLLFEDLAGTLLLNRFSGQYEKMGGWWNRRGDEIDFIALGRSEIPVAIEVKCRDMTAEDALAVLKRLDSKMSLIPGFFGYGASYPEISEEKVSGDFITGISEMQIKRGYISGIVAEGMDKADRRLLEDEGYLFYDIFEMVENYG